jgi:hypothetical protein
MCMATRFSRNWSCRAPEVVCGVDPGTAAPTGMDVKILRTASFSRLQKVTGEDDLDTTRLERRGNRLGPLGGQFTSDASPSLGRW